MTLAERATRDAEIIRRQTALLDHAGHVWPHLDPAEAAGMEAEINALRAANGWHPLTPGIGERRAPEACQGCGPGPRAVTPEIEAGYAAAGRSHGARYADYLRRHDAELAAKGHALRPWPLCLQGNDGI